MSEIDFSKLDRDFQKAEDITPPNVRKKRTPGENAPDQGYKEAVLNTPRLRETIVEPIEAAKVQHVTVQASNIQNTGTASLYLIIKNRKKRKDNDLR